MASVFNRGTRDNPIHVAVYNAGKKPDGKIEWRQKRVPEEHNKTKTAAQAWADDFERSHLAGPPPPTVPLAPTCGAR